MARGWHVKHVAPPPGLPGLGPRLLLALRPDMMRWVLGRVLMPRDGDLKLALPGGEALSFGTGAAAREAAGRWDENEAPPPAEVTGPALSAVEPDTGLRRDEAGKLAYFKAFGAHAATPMQGWDAPLAGALTRTERSPPPPPPPPPPTPPPPPPTPTPPPPTPTPRPPPPTPSCC